MIYIFYGTATGNSEVIANKICEKLKVFHDCKLLELNNYEKTSIFAKRDYDIKERVIIVCSTTGNGDPPDNTTKFWKFIRKRDHPKKLLKHINFTVLALGDSNYNKFCHVGKIIDKKLFDLGATRLIPIVCADDAYGLENVVEPFIKNLDKLFPKPKTTLNNYLKMVNNFLDGGSIFTL